MQKTSPQALPGVFELLSISWTQYRKRFFVFFWILFNPALLQLLSAIVENYLRSKSGFNFATTVLQAFGSSGVILFAVLAACFFIGIYVIRFWADVALIVAVTEESLTPEHIGTAFRRAWSLLLPYWWLGILLSLVVFGGFVLFVIPGIIVSVWLCFASYVFLTESKRGMDALIRSRQYVQGYWWPLFWRFFAGGVLYFFLVLLLRFSPLVNLLGINVLDPILSCLVTPFTLLYTYTLFQRRKSVYQVPTNAVGRGVRRLFVALATLAILVFAVPIFFLSTYVFLFRPFTMSGNSMYPNYQNGEYVLSRVLNGQIDALKRGDVIIFRLPTDTEKDMIKRIIGLPGDTVSLANGEVYVNGERLNEAAYLPTGTRTYGGSFLHETDQIVVPQRAYLVLGDNRPYSSDSREWGFVKKENIISRVLFCYWNCSAALQAQSTQAP